MAQDLVDGGLDEKGLLKLQRYIDMIDSTSDYLFLQDNQSEEVIFNLDSTDTGLHSRMIETEDGEKKLVKFRFLVKNLRLQRDQFLDLSLKWAKIAIQVMVFFDTKRLIIHRSGTGLDTNYSFLPKNLN